MTRYFPVAVAAILLGPLPASPALAKTETKAMLNTGCSIDKVRQITQGAATKVAANGTTNSVNITLDTTRMSWLDLTKKMHAAGCFK